MAYQVKWDIRAFKELKRIENMDAVEILNAVNKLQDNPIEAGKSLQGKFKGKYRLRVRDYRVVYWIEGKIVWIISVGHRKDIYA